MIIRPISLAPLIGGIVLLLSMSHPADAAEKWSGTGSIRFLGKSTLHDFTGTVAIAPFTLTVDEPEGREKATLSGTLTASVAKMDTQDEKRDENMRASLDAAKHPLITVSLSKVKVADTKPQWQGRLPKPSTVPFDLTILGKTKAHIGRVASWSEKDGVVTMVVAFPVSLKDYGIKVPTVLGVIRVKDTIEVEATIELKP